MAWLLQTTGWLDGGIPYIAQFGGASGALRVSDQILRISPSNFRPDTKISTDLMVSSNYFM